jgi:hypothetical protein
MSTPACMSAMNETTPPPPKPQYRAVNSIQHLVVRRLVPSVNASRALEKQMLASDSYCAAENPLNLFTPTINCSQLVKSSLLKRGLDVTKRLLALPGFPLPSIKDVTFLNTMSARFPLASWVFIWELCSSLLVILFWFTATYWPRKSANRRWLWKVYFQW